MPSKITYMTEECICKTTFTKLDVVKIITSLDVDKAYGNENISVRINKFCAEAVTHALTQISQHCLDAVRKK